MKKVKIQQPRIFARKKARELNAEELKQVAGGLPPESLSYSGGNGFDDSDV